MTEIETIVRRWGDSMAVIIPRDIVKEEQIKPKSKVRIRLVREDDLSDLFGKFRTKKTPKELKDEGREAWE